VKLAAQRHGLRVAQPQSLRTPDVLDGLGPPPDLMIVVAYGLLLPRVLLAWPRLGCVNLHASLLPRWRGAAPIQHAILARDGETGISVMRMEPGLDTGPVYLTSATPIGARETAGELHDRLAVLAARALTAALPRLLASEIEPVPQDDARATTAPKIAKSDAVLDWRCAAVELAARVRAFDPWPIAEARLDDGRRLRVWQAVAVGEATDAAPGTVVAAGREGIDVATGAGLLRLLKIQPPSARVMESAAYLAAHSLHGSAFIS